MCSITTKNKIVVVAESGRQFRLNNPNQIDIVLTTVDGCAITVGIRCDFLYQFLAEEIYVELKGADVRHAADQISASVPQLSATTLSGRTAAIVTSRVPREDTSTQRAKVLLRKQVARVIIKNTTIELAA